MTEHAGRETLENVLDAFVAAAETPSSDSLAEWIRRYPYYERELTEFAVAWSRMRWLPPESRSAEQEDAFVQRGMGVLRDILRRKAAEGTPPFRQNAAIKGLAAEAKAQGLSAAQLAAKVDLSLALVSKMDLRRFRYGTIPRQAIENLAQALGHRASVVAAYLIQPPQLAPSASHRAEQAPGLADQEDFFVAVQKDLQLSAEQRERWLALRPTDE